MAFINNFASMHFAITVHLVATFLHSFYDSVLVSIQEKSSSQSHYTTGGLSCAEATW